MQVLEFYIKQLKHVIYCSGRDSADRRPASQNAGGTINGESTTSDEVVRSLIIFSWSSVFIPLNSSVPTAVPEGPQPTVPP
jgi:hypothetical protein